MCIEFVDYIVIVKNKLVGLIIPGRGMRQGDPPWLYLFILCAKGSFVLIPYMICNDAPVICHLLFASDCFSSSERRSVKQR
jgi:hypothetical protein